MKKFGFASVVATGFAAALFALAAPAAADSVHHDWVQDIQPTVPSGLPPRLSATAADKDVKKVIPVWAPLRRVRRGPNGGLESCVL